jgi:putative methyltransferase (TIGR04325 family)
MNSFKYLLKKILPKWLIRFISGFFYGWHGNYKSWQEAEKRCSGYNSEIILKKVSESTMKVLKKEATFERDSVLFDQAEYNFPLLSALMWVAGQNKGNINVLDFGGALGSSYFQNKYFLEKLNNVKWCIIEQENFVKLGQEQFTTENLKFYYTINHCLEENSINFILLSSVIQYLEKPYELLDYLSSKNIKYLFIDRTGYFNKLDRITTQKVHPFIYKATYPCWFFNYNKFMDYITKKYELIYEFETNDRANIKSTFKGFLFMHKL